MSHAKRNTSLAFFTSHERSQLKSQWGSQTAQLTRDSFLPFGSCSLCLMPAQDPVACPGGPSSNRLLTSAAETKKRKPDALKGVCHIFCRECILNNLLAQRQEIKRQARVAEANAREREEVDALNDEEAKQRALEDFEAVQMGLERKLGSKSQSSTSNTDKKHEIVGRAGGKVTVEEQSDGKKRKFELDEAELVRIANEDRTKARKLLDEEKEAAKKHLPAFWLPSQAPEAQGASKKSDDRKSKESKPVCPASTKGSEHAIALKTLADVKWKEDTAKSDSKEKALICPACSRNLTNASKAVIARPCGHVLCLSCVHKFVLNDDDDDDPHGKLHADGTTQTKDIRCFVCEESLNGSRSDKSAKSDESKDKKDRDRDKGGLYEISTEGTGFSGAGGNMVKKQGVAFQFG